MERIGGRRAKGGIMLDVGLVQRAERKFRRYGTDLNGVLSVLVSARGFPAALLSSRRVAPVIEFEVQGERFTADVMPDSGSYHAQVRGLPDCFTCGDTEAEIRKNLVEVVKLMHFGMGEAVNDRSGDVRP